MPVTREEADRVWKLFSATPLWSQWPDFRLELPNRLQGRFVPAGQPIFNPGDPADFLYLIEDGLVEQTFGSNGYAWFRRELSKGEYFGQQSLFTERHHTRAVAQTNVSLYMLTAADLRMAMEKNPELRDALLHETRAGRLRSIPLLECMSDTEIRWLSMLVVEEQYVPNASLPLYEKRGLRIIDWGQIAVTGPAAFAPSGWRLTAGNFFLSPEVRFGLNCVAETATVTLKSNLFYLEEEHFYRLLRAFPEMGDQIHRPLDIEAILAGVPQIASSPGMTEDRLRYLAQFCAWAYVPDKQNISTQGAVGYSFVIIRRGAALVSAVDNEGRLRPRNLLKAHSAFGMTSLLQSKHRDATVRAVAAPTAGGRMGIEGAELIILDRRDLRHAFAEKPELWDNRIWLYDQSEQVKEERLIYEWQQEGEVVAWRGRGHWLWLAIPVAALFAGLIAVLFLVGLAAPIAGTLIETVLLLLTGLVFLPSGLYLSVNYFNDYYVITNRRVTRREREVFFFEGRTDAPLEMVQDVTVGTNLTGRIFNFGNVTIRTAAKVGAIVFAHVPDPDGVRDMILLERAEAAAASRGQNREVLRRGLMSSLRLVLSVPDLDQLRALGENVPRPVPQTWRSRLRHFLWPDRPAALAALPGSRRGRPAWFRRLFQPLPERWRLILLGPPPPPVRPLAGQIVWHKHWVNLMQRAGWPFLAVLALLVVMLGIMLAPPDALAVVGFGRLSLLLALLVPLLPAAAWLWWEVTDYWNDIYVVTDDRIIDIEKRPLSLSAQRRESPLDRVQTVNAEQKGLWANLLSYGNVVIHTAAADTGFTFEMVGAPRLVQKVIFQKLDAYRRRQEERTLVERQRALIEGIEVYHELREDQNRPRRPV